jgi:hypothetical protein
MQIYVIQIVPPIIRTKKDIHTSLIITFKWFNFVNNINLKNKNMKEFAIGVATVTVGVALGMIVAHLVQTKVMGA